MSFLKSKIKHKALIASLILASSFYVNASEEAFGFDDESLLFADIESVFTASKYSQKVTEAPARISIVTAKEIQQYGYRSMVDVLNTLPGFQTSYDRSFSYVGARGFAIPGDYNSRILLLVDGHRVNENIYSGMIIDNGLAVNIDIIDRIEVVRGSGSSLYGNGAFFGVINIMTKRGRDLQGVQTIVSTGSQNTHTATVSYGNRFDNGVEVLLSGSYYESDGDDKLYYPEFDDPTTNNGFATSVDSGKNDNLFAKLAYNNFTVTASYQEQEKVNPTGSYETVFNSPITRGWEQTFYVDAKYQELLSDGTDISARIFYDEYNYMGHWAYDYSDEGDLSDIVNWQDEANGKWWGSELMVTKEFFQNHRVTLGGEYRNNFDEKSKSWDIYEVFQVIDTNSYTWGVYLQDNIQLHENLVLNLGLRYDYFSELDNSTNPRIAAIWDPIDNTTVKLIYGSAYRAPNVYELYYDDIGISQKAPDQLSPETINSIELILEQRLNNSLNLVASLYQNKIEKLIALTTDPSDDLLVFENQNDVTAKGFEIELQGHWQNGWNGAFSYTYQNSEFDISAITLPNVPQDQVKLNITTPELAYGFTAGLNLQYESARKTLQNNHAESYLLTNLTVLNKTLVNNLDLSFGIYNLFDEHYSFPGSEEHLQDQIAQDGRTVRLRLAYTFDL
ncbi:TonB-dependent receptor [Colwellia sp. BRX10-3]|uniref:TonB-dependent receptor plug domain-containing protein n=1 Tax=Colwellia sp. BRX10-3 TaxID=2759844 RepID=UPI0015F53BAC|nr:TonB-dependent receptor [Colwellia sp. BRX10-3]MBA6391575.1 TonB-dependent receptor [Colwellia sp. BRX10-3]